MKLSWYLCTSQQILGTNFSWTLYKIIENILNGVLLGSVLGSSFVAIIVVVASVLITVFLLKKGISYGFESTRITMSLIICFLCVQNRL